MEAPEVNMVSSQRRGAASSSMREKLAERDGERRAVFTARPNPRYQADMRVHKSSECQPYLSGGVYEGHWRGDMRNGYGTQTCVSGNKYEGEWVGGKRHGKGTLWVRQPGRNGGVLRKQYAGDWAFDKREGVGVQVYEDGGRYEGKWAAGARSGQGKMLYANGDAYEGAWAGGKRNGIGVLRRPNGDSFEGHWLGDRKEGPGRYLFMSTRKVYEGEWAEDAPRCGTYRDMDDAVVDPDVPDESFPLPPLALQRPQTVLSDSIAAARAERARLLGQAGRAFQSAELDRLRLAFDDAGGGGRSGLLPAAALAPLLERIGIVVEESSAAALLEELQLAGEAGEEMEISFADFVDVVSLLATES